MRAIGQLGKGTWYLGLVIFLCLPGSVPASGENTEATTVQGVATPQNESERGNVEVLRARALRNAVELALGREKGVRITTERSDRLRTSDKVADGKLRSRQASSFRSHVTSETTGHARVTRVLDEGFQGESYHITALVELIDSADIPNARNLGFFWSRAGAPKLGLQVIMDNPARTGGEVSSMEEYLRENLARNGVTVVRPGADWEVLVQVEETFDTSKFAGLDTFTTHCSLSLKLRNSQRQERGAARLRSGPTAGFNEAQSQSRCLEGIAESFADQLVRELAALFDELWRNGRPMKVEIDDLPEGQVGRVAQLVEEMFGVTAVSEAGYSDGRLSLLVKYRGAPQELVRDLDSLGKIEDFRLIPVTVGRGQVTFTWRALQ